MIPFPLYGLILAGGLSTRMGSDKSALCHYDQPHVRHLSALLSMYVKDVYISIRAAQKKASHLVGLKTIIDYYNSPSPLNGIVSAMRHYPNISWLVIAVDMPNVTAISIEKLISARDAASVATCFASPVKGGPDPLLAIWEGSYFKPLESMIAETRDHICPRQVLKKLQTKVLFRAVPDEELANVNTPQELESLRSAP